MVKKIPLEAKKQKKKKKISEPAKETRILIQKKKKIYQNPTSMQ